MIVPVDIVSVQCNQNNSLFVTTGVDYDNNGAVAGSEITAQYTLVPGDSLDGQPVEVVNIANALWTPAVVEVYKAANPVVVKDASTNSWSNDSVTGTPATLRAEQIVDPLNLPTSDVPPSLDGMTNTILG
jgi:hypothetical protein